MECPYRDGGSGPVAPAMAGPLIVKKIFFFQVILYTDIMCCLYFECNVQYIFYAKSENVPKIAYLGI